MNRQENNREILAKLSELVAQYPDQRFGQIIANYVFPDYREADFYYEEPSETLRRMEHGRRIVNLGDGVLYSCDPKTQMAAVVGVASPEDREICIAGVFEVDDIPYFASEVKPGAFRHCHALEVIYVDSANLYLSDIDGVLYDRNETTLLKVPAQYEGELVIPSTVTAIAPDAFEGYKGFGR